MAAVEHDLRPFRALTAALAAHDLRVRRSWHAGCSPRSATSRASPGAGQRVLDAGLTPVVDQSADIKRCDKRFEQGSPRVRSAIVQATQHAARRADSPGPPARAGTSVPSRAHIHRHHKNPHTTA
jgi:hypothetical protein